MTLLNILKWVNIQSWPNKKIYIYIYIYIHIIPIQNSFDTITMIFYKRIKSHGVGEEEHDFIIRTPKTYILVKL